MVSAAGQGSGAGAGDGTRRGGRDGCRDAESPGPQSGLSARPGSLRPEPYP